MKEPLNSGSKELVSGPWRRASFEEGGELGKAAELYWPEKKEKNQDSVPS